MAAISPVSEEQSSKLKDTGINVQVRELSNEPSQEPLLAAIPATAAPSFNISSDFQIHDVDTNLGSLSKQRTELSSSAPPPLGVLSNFKGTFHGTGLNLIFRPNSGPPTTTQFPNPITPAAPTPPSENVLEINLTTETLAFSTPIGTVPNRGLEKQNDIFLNGVPYVQSINDVTNIATGHANGTPAPIHFEPGLWMHVPATSDDPTLGESLVRMASIPHGTTINAQALAPTGSFAGPPIFAAVDITPFPIGGGKPIPFVSQIATNTATPRLPQDLTKFIAAGTITQDILTDPNTVLRNAIKGQVITKTIVFTVSTTPQAPELGGGTANIAFLQGGASGPQTGPNASAVQMSATFWIETVEHKLVVPVFKPGQAPLRLSPQGAKSPIFQVTPPHEITAPKTIVVSSTQIQYSQLVFLNFAGLTWPHVSVATLVPLTLQSVPASVWN